MRKVLLSVSACAVALLMSVSADAKKPKAHGGRYLLGTVVEQKAVAGGTIEHCYMGNCTTVPISSRITHVKTDEGIYTVAQPYRIPLSGPTEYIPWFVTDLHDGDKLLFGVSCSASNNCIYWVPEPGNPDREIKSEGRFHPFRAKDNTRALCGTGKLSAELEATLCQSAKAESH
jgi:hypothetical protein